MPFLSKDWRSPGEKWVRYDGGWKMKKTVWATQAFRPAMSSAGSLGSLSSSGEDSGCEAGSDNEVNNANNTSDNVYSTSPGSDVEAGEDQGRRKDSFGFEEEDDESEESDDQAEMRRWSVKDRARTLMNRLSGGSSSSSSVGSAALAIPSRSTAATVAVVAASNVAPAPNRSLAKSSSNSNTLPCDLRRRALHRASVAAASLPEGYAAQLDSRSVLFDRSDRLHRPYVHIHLKSTKEVAGFNAIADALLRLDFVNAVRDTRRFAFVAKIVYMLFSHDRLNQLPGAAQKLLFRVLEEMAVFVYRNQGRANEHVLRKLLDELNATMTVYHVWGAHLGSGQLFRQHLESRRRIIEIVEKMQVKYKQDLAIPSARSSNSRNRNRGSDSGLVGKLPEECIREIMLKLSDPKDVERAGEACLVMGAIARERRVWRELAQTHFTQQQIDTVLRDRPELLSPGGGEQKEWKHLYKCLRWKFGLRERYTETLALCRRCSCLCWRSIGHPCQAPENSSSNNGNNNEESEELVTPVSPQMFLTFFSV